MKKLPFFFLLASLWVVTTMITAFAEADSKREAPPQSEAQKKRAERESKPAPSTREADPRRATETKVEAEKKDTGKTGPTQTWLGVATAPLPYSLRDYLEVEEGFGVQIFQVMDGSPASDAGLMPKDVLVLFDDQMLISPEHLSLLVRRLKKDDEVKVTVIRKGMEKELEVILGATDLRPYRGGPGGDQNFRAPHGPIHPQARHWEETMRRQQDHFQKWIKDHETRREEAGDAEAENEPVPGKPPAISVRPGFPVEVLTAEGVIKIDNEKGELTITNKSGKHEMLLKDEKGKTVFEGKYDPEAGPESLPEEAREHLKKMKLDDLKVLTPNVPKPKPENASQPIERASLESARSESLL